MKELGLVLSTADRRDVGRAIGLARAARTRGLDVSVFLMDAAVTWSEEFAELIEDGCEVVACTTSLAGRAAHAGVLLGSQDDHAAIVHRADRVVAFT